jgi:hypothetical protein
MSRATLNLVRVLEHHDGCQITVELVDRRGTKRRRSGGESVIHPYVQAIRGESFLVSHWVQQEAPEKVNEILGAWLGGRGLRGGRPLDTGVHKGLF